MPPWKSPAVGQAGVEGSGWQKGLCWVPWMEEWKSDALFSLLNWIPGVIFFKVGSKKAALTTDRSSKGVHQISCLFACHDFGPFLRTRTLFKPEAKAPEPFWKPARGLFWGAIYFPASLAPGPGRGHTGGGILGLLRFWPHPPSGWAPWELCDGAALPGPASLAQELCLVLGPSLGKLHWCQLASRRRGRLIPRQLQSCPGRARVPGVGMEVPPWGRAAKGLVGCHLRRCFLFPGR